MTAAVSGSLLGVVCRGTADLTRVPAVVLVVVGFFGALLAGRNGARERPLILCAALLAGFVSTALLPRVDASPPRVSQIDVRGAQGDIPELLARLDDDPRLLLGRTLQVDGRWRNRAGERPATVSQTLMSCCAADAVTVGFDVYPRHAPDIRDGASVRVAGVLTARMVDGMTRYALADGRVWCVNAKSNASC